VILKDHSLGEILTTSLALAVIFCGEKNNPRSPTVTIIVSQFIQFIKCIIINNHIKYLILRKKFFLKENENE
jgi:hypothetical protein